MKLSFNYIRIFTPVTKTSDCVLYIKFKVQYIQLQPHQNQTTE